jgi:surfactin synthase thioesterase subunit
VYGARLAGRENRHAEPVAETSDQVVAEIISELTSLGVPRIALFGQCSGALLAYGLARKLAESGQGLEVEHLIVASQLPPSVFPEVDLDLGQDLTQYVPEDFRDEPEFVDMMLPVIAADMKLVSDFAYSADVPLQVPITVVYGDRDQMLGRPEVEDWCRETTGPVNFHEISDGDHLISGPAWLKLAKTIRAVLA